MNSDINYIIQESLKGDKIYREVLLKRLNPLIYKNIYKYYSPSNPLVEDLVQEGYIIILQSLKDYDEKRNVHFLQYVKIRLYYFYKNHYKKNIKHVTLSIDYLDNVGKEIKAKDFEQITAIILEEENDELYKCINKLSENEQTILNLFYFQSLSIQQISDKLNLKYNSIVNMKMKAVKRLRKMMTIH